MNIYNTYTKRARLPITTLKKITRKHPKNMQNADF